MLILSLFDLTGDQMFYTILGVIPLIFIIIILAILFIRSIFKLYQTAVPEHRTIEPIMTWLLMIPIFNFVWLFVVLRSVQQLLYKELKERNIEFKGERLYNIGVVLGVSNVFVLFPYIRYLTIPLSFILFFIYWHSIKRYHQLLLSDPLPLTNSDQTY